MSVRVPSLLRRAPRLKDGFDGVLVLRNGRPYDPAWDRWRPVRRWPGVLISAIVTALLLVAVAYHFEHRVAQARPVFKLPQYIPYEGPYFPPIKATTAAQGFAGTSKEFNLPMTSSGNLSSWTFTCACTNNFAVQVRDFTGKLVDVPLNELGATRLTALANYPRGHYTIDVLADGKWKVNLIEESRLAVITKPFEYFSSGSSVLGPFSASSTSLGAGYVGSLGQLFSVQVYGANGVLESFPIFTIRSGLFKVKLTGVPNPYYLVVKGTGRWFIGVL